MRTRSERLTAGAVVLVMAMSGCGGEGASPTASCEPGQTDGDLVLANWSEYVDPALLEDFEADAGVTVIEEFFSSNEDLAEALAAGTRFDLAVPSDYLVGDLIDQGELMRLDRDAVPNLANLDERFAVLPGDPDGAHAVAYQWGTTGLAIDTEVLGTDIPRSWSVLFDPTALPAGASAIMLDDPRESLAAALRHLGHSINTTDEEAIRAAGELIQVNRDRIVSFDTDTGLQRLLAGEVAVAHAYSGNAVASFAEADDPDRYEYFVPDEGGVRWVDAMVVPADAEHPCTAHRFIDFILDAEQGARLTEWNAYGSPNAAAEARIDPQLLEDPTVYPPPEVQERLEFLTDVGDAATAYATAFGIARD